MDPAAVLLLQIVIWIVSGLLVGYLASQRGRHPVGWFFIGVAAPCIGLILVLVLPDLKKAQEDDLKSRRENRRLREQLGQERMKNQAFRGHVTNRLDTHDEQLGIDTRSTAPSAELPPPPPPREMEGIPDSGWYSVQPGEEAEGPFVLAEMRTMMHEGRIGAKTLIWHETLEEWMPLERSPLRTLA